MGDSGGPVAAAMIDNKYVVDALVSYALDESDAFVGGLTDLPYDALPKLSFDSRLV